MNYKTTLTQLIEIIIICSLLELLWDMEPGFLASNSFIVTPLLLKTMQHVWLQIDYYYYCLFIYYYLLIFCLFFLGIGSNTDVISLSENEHITQISIDTSSWVNVITFVSDLGYYSLLPSYPSPSSLFSSVMFYFPVLFLIWSKRNTYGPYGSIASNNVSVINFPQGSALSGITGEYGSEIDIVAFYFSPI